MPILNPTPTFYHGKQVFVLFNGYDITGFLNKIDTPLTSKTAETSTFGTEDESYLSGLRNCTMTADGFYDESIGAIDKVLSKALANNGENNDLVWIPVGGNVIGNKAFGIHMIETAYNTMATKDEAVKISMAGQSSVGREKLLILENLVSKASSGVTAYQDNLITGASGGSAYIQATAVTGTLDVVIEDSPDHIVWNTLATFDTLTGVGYQRKEFSGVAGVVNRYLRVTYTIGTGPAVFLVGIHVKNLV